MLRLFFLCLFFLGASFFLTRGASAETHDGGFCLLGTCRIVCQLSGETPNGTCSNGFLCCVANGENNSLEGDRSGSNAGTSSGISCPGGEVRAGVCFPTSTGLSSQPVGDLLMKLMNWLLGIVGIIAIIAFIISGLQYFLAAGDEKMAETAKRNMEYAIIGIIVALSGLVIITAIDQALRGTLYMGPG